MVKHLVIERINLEKNYKGSEVAHIVNQVTSIKNDVTKLKKGDVILQVSGAKTRPAVIIKVFKDRVITIPLTSEENPHSLFKANSRFFGESWFCNLYMISTIEYAKNNFAGVYDNSKDVNKAIKALKEFIGTFI